MFSLYIVAGSNIQENNAAKTKENKDKNPNISNPKNRSSQTAAKNIKLQNQNPPVKKNEVSQLKLSTSINKNIIGEFDEDLKQNDTLIQGKVTTKSNQNNQENIKNITYLKQDIPKFNKKFNQVTRSNTIDIQLPVQAAKSTNNNISKTKAAPNKPQKEKKVSNVSKNTESNIICKKQSCQLCSVIWE